MGLTPLNWSKDDHGFHCNPFKPCGLCKKETGNRVFGAYGLSGKIVWIIRIIRGNGKVTTRDVYK